MKICRECGVSKPLSEYYVHKEMSDGHLNKCKLCVRLRVANHLKANAEYYKQYEKQRNSLPHRVDARKAYAKTEKGKLATKKAHKKYIESFPLRRAAHIIVSNAVKNGDLIKQPCFICGEKAEAHHPDYSRPLDVVWLCSHHHKEVHLITKE